MKIREAGESETTGAAVTVSVTVVVWARLPEVPTSTPVCVPAVAVGLADNVKVLSVVAGLGLNTAVTPLGRSEPESETLPPNPLYGVMVIVLVA